MWKKKSVVKWKIQSWETIIERGEGRGDYKEGDVMAMRLSDDAGDCFF